MAISLYGPYYLFYRPYYIFYGPYYTLSSHDFVSDLQI